MSPQQLGQAALNQSESLALYEATTSRSDELCATTRKNANDAAQGEPRDKDKLLLSLREAQTLLNIGETLFKSLIRSGELRSVKIGSGRGRRLVSRVALEQFIVNNETGGWK